jgi:hypothetical protein
VNIEGLASRNGRLFVGLRGPNLDGNAFVLEVGANDVFGGKSQPSYTLHRLQMGPGLGVREIGAVRSGFLLIAGNSASEPSEKYTQSVDMTRTGIPHGRGTEPGRRSTRSAHSQRDRKAEASVLEELGPRTVLVLFEARGRAAPRSIDSIDHGGKHIG